MNYESISIFHKFSDFLVKVTAGSNGHNKQNDIFSYILFYDGQVEIVQNDQHRLKIFVDNENEIDLMVQTRGLRDIIVLVLRGFAQRFNGTASNANLKWVSFMHSFQTSGTILICAGFGRFFCACNIFLV